VKCPPLNWEVLILIYSHWVNHHIAPCSRAFTQTAAAISIFQASACRHLPSIHKIIFQVLCEFWIWGSLWKHETIGFQAFWRFSCTGQFPAVLPSLLYPNATAPQVTCPQDIYESNQDRKGQLLTVRTALETHIFSILFPCFEANAFVVQNELCSWRFAMLWSGVDIRRN